MAESRKLAYLGIFDPPQAVAPPEEPPCDRVALVQKWRLAQQELEQAAEWGKLPDRSTEFVYSPHIDVLKERLVRNWARLAEEPVIASCRALVGKAAGDVGATLLMLTVWRIALLEAGHHDVAEAVADLQSAYLHEQGFTPEEPHVRDDAEQTPADTDGTAE